MQHLRDCLTSKKFNFKNIASTNTIEITEKIDGSAFQCYYDGKNIIYGKRGENPYKPVNNKITEFDLLMNPLYYKVYNYLNQYMDVIKQYKILNFEIFDKNLDNHIIKYKGQYKNDIVILSGLSLNNEILTNNELKEIAEKLNISYNKILWSGILNNEQINTILNNKYNDCFLWIYFLDELNIIDNREYEGFVITFKDIFKNYKLQNPYFTKILMNHLNEEKNNRNINLEKYYDLIINKQFKFNKTYSHIKNLLMLYYMSFEHASDNYTEIEKTLKNIEILRNTEINMILAHKIYNEFPINKSNISYPALLNFILYAFRAKRKRFPIWCSKSYQENKINPFLENNFNL